MEGDVNFDDFYERSRPIYSSVFFDSVSFATLNCYAPIASLAVALMRKMTFNVWQETLTLSGRISTKLTDDFDQSFVRFSNSVSSFLCCNHNFVYKFSGIFKNIFNVLKEDFNVEPKNFDGFRRRFRAIILLCS